MLLKISKEAFHPLHSHSHVVVQFVVPSLEGDAFSEAFSKYALVCTCMCQFAFMSGSCWGLVRYMVKHDISLEASFQKRNYIMHVLYVLFICILLDICFIAIESFFLLEIPGFTII